MTASFPMGRRAPVILAAWCLTGSAQAQTPSDLPIRLTLEELMEVEVPSVVGASRFAQQVVDAPASVTIVTSDEIERFGYRTLADVLRGVRGFYINYDRNYNYVGARGFLRPGDYNSRILLLLDGHRLNDNIYDAAPIGTDFPVDLELIERVEIVRGPSSSLYGTSAFFAVVNVITRRGSTGRSEAGFAFGSQSTVGARLGFARRFGAAGDLQLSASQYGSDGELHVPVAPGTALKLLHGTAFRAPNLYELYYYGNNTAELEPERIRTTEVVWEQHLQGPTRITGSVFHYRIDNLIAQVPADGIFQDIGFANLGVNDATGVEAELERSFGRLQLFGSYTFTASGKRDHSGQLSNSPRNLGVARASTPLFNRRATLAMSWVYTSERRTLAGEMTSGFALGALTIASGELAGGLRVAFDVHNVLDRQYSDPGAEEHLVRSIRMDEPPEPRSRGASDGPDGVPLISP